MSGVAASISGASADRARAHPLDPLSGPELERAAAVAIAAVSGDGTRPRVVDVSLHEPSKQAVLAGDGGEQLEREAFVVLLDRVTGAPHELVVSLDRDCVISSRLLDGVQAAITMGEFAECERIVRADPAFQDALQRRGVDSSDLVTVEAWGIGTHTLDSDRGRRLVWTPCWVRDDPADNPYAHPIDGLFAIVDLSRMEVVRIEDHGVAEIPKTSGRYTPEAIGVPLRGDLRTMEVNQPDGPSFAVDGWEVRWQRWSFRVGFTAREGLVLHRIAYTDGERERPIVYRASYSELTVPYADPGPGGYRKAAFDIGEYGAGPLTNSLMLGCDCLGEIYYFDVDLCADTGRSYTIRNAICLHEEDAGILWKHYDAATDHAEVRRCRRLVISSILTAANYEYAFYWYLYQDGSIESEVKATGIVITQSSASDPDGRHSVLVAPDLVAPIHQHFFCVRLDMQVDGLCNTVQEVDAESLPLGPDNPHGNAFRTVTTTLERESKARRLIDPFRARYWMILNEQSHNALGGPVGYRLVPGGNVLPFAHPDSDVMARAGFMGAHLWVTRYDQRERFASGDYPNQHPGGAGLPAYQKADRLIVSEDLVVWYTFAHHHVPRPEEWPVMPVERIGFALRPDGFFDRNPAIDVPPSHADHCRAKPASPEPESDAG